MEALNIFDALRKFPAMIQEAGLVYCQFLIQTSTHFPQWWRKPTQAVILFKYPEWSNCILPRDMHPSRNLHRNWFERQLDLRMKWELHNILYMKVLRTNVASFSLMHSVGVSLTRRGTTGRQTDKREKRASHVVVYELIWQQKSAGKKLILLLFTTCRNEIFLLWIFLRG